jgi:hypothetical protein
MDKLYCFAFFFCFCSYGQSLVRVEPQNFTSVFSFGTNGNFNTNEVAVFGYDAMFPNGVNKLYLFNSATGMTPNGVLQAPETNQKLGGGIEMTDNYLYVGSSSNTTNVLNGGAVYVFKKVNNVWTYLLKIQPSFQFENDYFGSNIVFHNNQLFITAAGYDSSGSPTVNNGAIYVYNQTNDTFAFQQVLTGVAGNFSFGTSVEIENDMLVTTSGNLTADSVHTLKKINAVWQLVNTTQMPAFDFAVGQPYVPNFWRASFSNEKLYLYHILEDSQSMLGQKMIKIYNWSNSLSEWTFTENFMFTEGDYLEYKVKVKGNNMFIVPVGEYILQIERKNPAYHYKFNGATWSYYNGYTGMSTITNDNFGFFTLIKDNKVLFGNSSERWNSPVTPNNGGAYTLDVTLSTNQYERPVVNVYPNPTDGMTTIDFLNSVISSVEIYDSLGKMVFEQKSESSLLNLSHLKSGIYFCKIISVDNEVAYQKIIKR